MVECDADTTELRKIQDVTCYSTTFDIHGALLQHQLVHLTRHELALQRVDRLLLRVEAAVASALVAAREVGALMAIEVGQLEQDQR